MHNNTSISSRIAAAIGAMAITGFMLVAYFAPPASAAIGVIA